MGSTFRKASPDILITGATSFVGRHLTRFLIAQGYSLAVVTRSKTHEVNSLGRVPVQVFEGDLSDQKFVTTLPSARLGVVHLAASGTAPSDSAEKIMRDNCIASVNLLSYILKTENPYLIFASSMSVYGDVEQPVISLRTPCEPLTVYGASKVVIERLLGNYRDTIPSIAIRLPAVLGSGASTHFVARLASDALRSRPLNVFEPSALFNNVVHVDDLCIFLHHLLLNKTFDAKPFPIASTTPITIYEVADIFRRLMPNSLEINVSTSSRPSFYVDDSYARTFLGYTSLSTQQAIEKYAATIAAEIQ